MAPEQRQLIFSHPDTKVVLPQIHGPLDKAIIWVIINQKGQILLQKDRGSNQLELASQPLPQALLEHPDRWEIRMPVADAADDSYSVWLLVAQHEAESAIEQAADRSRFYDIRMAGQRIVPKYLDALSRALHVMQFLHEFRHCPKCGHKLEMTKPEAWLLCPACAHQVYAQVKPVALVLVTHGDKILLGRSPGFPPGMYSLLAGYVEAGETLEQACAREIFEESGVRITDVRYHSSQNWPLSQSLMCGFTARAQGAEIKIKPDELEDARWFGAGELPLIPPAFALAGLMIREWARHYE